MPQQNEQRCATCGSREHQPSQPDRRPRQWSVRVDLLRERRESGLFAPAQ